MKPFKIDPLELQHMPDATAILIGYIRERFRIVYTGLAEGDIPDNETIEEAQQGWVCITGKQLERDINMFAWKYTKHLKMLVMAEYIKIKRKGLPAKRWIYLINSPYNVYNGNGEKK